MTLDATRPDLVDHPFINEVHNSKYPLDINLKFVVWSPPDQSLVPIPAADVTIVHNGSAGRKEVHTGPTGGQGQFSYSTLDVMPKTGNEQPDLHFEVNLDGKEWYKDGSSSKSFPVKVWNTRGWKSENGTPLFGAFFGPAGSLGPPLIVQVGVLLHSNLYYEIYDYEGLGATTMPPKKKMHFPLGSGISVSYTDQSNTKKTDQRKDGRGLPITTNASSQVECILFDVAPGSDFEVYLTLQTEADAQVQLQTQGFIKEPPKHKPAKSVLEYEAPISLADVAADAMWKNIDHTQLVVPADGFLIQLPEVNFRTVATYSMHATSAAASEAVKAQFDSCFKGANLTKLTVCYKLYILSLIREYHHFFSELAAVANVAGQAERFPWRGLEYLKLYYSSNLDDWAFVKPDHTKSEIEYPDGVVAAPGNGFASTLTMSAVVLDTFRFTVFHELTHALIFRYTIEDKKELNFRDQSRPPFHYPFMAAPTANFAFEEGFGTFVGALAAGPDHIFGLTSVDKSKFNWIKPLDAEFRYASSADDDRDTFGPNQLVEFPETLIETLDPAVAYGHYVEGLIATALARHFHEFIGPLSATGALKESDGTGAFSQNGPPLGNSNAMERFVETILMPYLSLQPHVPSEGDSILRFADALCANLTKAPFKPIHGLNLAQYYDEYYINIQVLELLTPSSTNPVNLTKGVTGAINLSGTGFRSDMQVQLFKGKTTVDVLTLDVTSLNAASITVQVSDAGKYGVRITTMRGIEEFQNVITVAP